MRVRIRFSFIIVLACSNTASAQSFDRTVDTASAIRPDRFATCDVRQVITKIVKTKVATTANGSCDTGGGGEKNCQVNVGATANNYVLDRGDVREVCYKLPDGGDNPCAFVRNGGVVFGSEKSASEIFSTNSGRVTMQLIIGQFDVSQVLDSDNVIQSNLQLFTGKQFGVKRTKLANSTVSLECKKPNGDQFVNLIPGNDNSGGKIKQVSVENGGAFDLYIMEVVP
jgi:hypothetical protein